MADPALNLDVHLEPIVRLKDHVVVGQELLLRPLHGGDIVEEARRAGISLASITRRALREGGSRLGTTPGKLHLNVLPEDLATPLFASTVAAAVGHGGCRSLVLEVTEHSAVTDSPILRHNVSTLRAMGVRFAIDDFGDGNANAESVRILQPEVVKVRLEQIAGPGARPGLARWLRELGAQSGAAIIVEQIETEADLATVAALHFDYGQGWLWTHARGASGDDRASGGG